MNAYGVLGAYLPVFGRIVGQMQHDLFHVYTVDAHTLFVVRNLRRFTVPDYRHEFPLASELIQQRRQTRAPAIWPACFTTSPKAGAATTPNLASTRSSPSAGDMA